MTDPSKDSCATCRHHHTESRPRVVQEVFDSIVEFADEDDKVFVCGVTSKEVGLEPILCDSFEHSTLPRASRLDELDKLIARSALRAEAREQEQK